MPTDDRKDITDHADAGVPIDDLMPRQPDEQSVDQVKGGQSDIVIMKIHDRSNPA